MLLSDYLQYLPTSYVGVTERTVHIAIYVEEIYVKRCAAYMITPTHALTVLEAKNSG